MVFTTLEGEATDQLENNFIFLETAGVELLLLL
jgi:hypothetical protein